MTFPDGFAGMVLGGVMSTNVGNLSMTPSVCDRLLISLKQLIWSIVVDRGWVKLHRRIDENLFLMNDDKAYLVFTKLLLKVNSSGQWAGGRQQLAEYMNMNGNTLYKVLKRLDEQQLITISSNNRYTVYSICNWHKYQSAGNIPNQLPVTSQQQRGNNTVTTQQHYYKNKELRIKNKNLAAGLNKKTYRAAVRADEQLAEKERAARTRPPDPTGSKRALSAAEIFNRGGP
jgi:hypothetical protein